MQTVAIVDSYAPTRRLVECFRESGARVVRVLSTPQPPVVYRGYDGGDLFADTIVHDGDDTSMPGLAEAVSQYEPCAVVAGGELGVELADALSARLRLPTNGTELSAARRDKVTMLDTLRARDVPVGQHVRVQDEGHLRHWHQSLGKRIVIKPVRSAAGDNVHYCNSPDEAVAAYRKIATATNVFSERNIGVIAQEYLWGAEYMVNTVGRDGVHRVCEIWETSRLVANGLIDIGESAYVIDRHGPVQDVLADYAEHVLDALGIANGPAHIEVKLTPDGPRLIEVGARIAGGNMPSHARLAIGQSQLDWTVRAYLDPDGFRSGATESYERTCGVGNVALIPTVQGRLRRYRHLDLIESLESFHASDLHVQPGDVVRRTVDDETYPAAFVLVHPVDAVVRRDALTIRHLDGPDMYELEPIGATA